jgi:hypothetical protein
MMALLSLLHIYAAIAQLVEQLICNHQVPSSILGGGTISPLKNNKLFLFKGKQEKLGEASLYQFFTNHCLRFVLLFVGGLLRPSATLLLGGRF